MSVRFISLLIHSSLVDGGINLGNGMLSLGVTKDIQPTGLGYACHVNIGEDSFSIQPQILYQVTPMVTLSGSITLSLNGELLNSFGVSYNLTANKTASIFLNTRLSDLTLLKESCLVLVYNH